MAKASRNNSAPSFRLRIRELMESEKFHTQRAMAEQLGVPASVLCNYAAGRTFPTLRTAVDFVLKLKLNSLDELVEIKGVEKKS